MALTLLGPHPVDVGLRRHHSLQTDIFLDMSC